MKRGITIVVVVLSLVLGVIGYQRWRKGTQDPIPSSLSPSTRGARKGDQQAQGGEPRQFVGGKLTVIDGRLGERGSKGAVKLKRSDGAVIEAGQLQMNEDGGVTLFAPVRFVFENGGEAIQKEGSLVINAEGIMQPSEGRLEVVKYPANSPKPSANRLPSVPPILPIPKKE